MQWERAETLNVDSKGATTLMNNDETRVVKGQCFCGKVRFEVHGPLSDVTICHCRECRRFHGHLGAYTFTTHENVKMLNDACLKWRRSLNDFTPNVRKGFCSECGSSLFSDQRVPGGFAIAAGVLEPPTGLKIKGHVWMEQAGDYYKVADGTPQMRQKWVDPEK